MLLIITQRRKVSRVPGRQKIQLPSVSFCMSYAWVTFREPIPFFRRRTLFHKNSTPDNSVSGHENGSLIIITDFNGPFRTLVTHTLYSRNTWRGTSSVFDDYRIVANRCATRGCLCSALDKDFDICSFPACFNIHLIHNNLKKYFVIFGITQLIWDF